MGKKTNIKTSLTISVFLLVMTVLMAGATLVYGRVPTILLVSDCSAPGAYTGTPPYDVNERDNTLVWFLEGLGYTVDTSGMNKAYQKGQNPFSDPAKVTALDASDLVIVSRHTNSGDYDNDRQNWNQLQKPLVLMSGYLTRGGGNNRWGWTIGGSTDANLPQTDIVIKAGQETHPFVAGFTSPITAFDWTFAPTPGHAPKPVFLPSSAPVAGAIVIGRFDGMPILMDIPAGTNFDAGNTNGPYGIAGGRRAFLATWGYDIYLGPPLNRDATFTDFLTEDYNDLFAQMLSVLAPRELYVDDDASAGGDGLSWATAFKYLQDALTIALDEIRVAQGTYKPDANSTVPLGSGDRSATFQLIDGVTIKGGYAGLGEPDPDARDIEAYETILSGDIGTTGDNSDNSYHVVTGVGADATAILDGFTITAGNANVLYQEDKDSGGGMYNYQGSPTVTDCNFTGNTAIYGGGMWNIYSSPVVTNCTFSGNSANHNSGGMLNQESSPTVVNCTFSGNSANYYGGMGNDTHSSPVVTNCTFSGNWANYDGGGMHNDESSPTVTNCTFSGNSGNWHGGGMSNWSSSNPTVTNCTFSGNSAGLDGGGMYNWSNSNPIVTNCILWGNWPDEIANYNSNPTVSYSDVQGGWSGAGGNNINADPYFADAIGGDLRLRPISPCIDAGNNTAVPADTADLDNDGNTVEPIPFDLGGFPRFSDDLCAPDTGNGTVPIVDMGAYEFLPADIDGSGTVDLRDFSMFALYWAETSDEYRFWDKFEQYDPNAYTFENSYGSGGSFEVSGGKLHITTGTDNTASVMTSDTVTFGVGATLSLEVPEVSGPEGVFMMCSTTDGQPDGTTTFGFRFRRDNALYARIDLYPGGMQTNTLDPDPTRPAILCVERTSDTDFYYSIIIDEVKTLLGSFTLPELAGIINLHIGAQAFDVSIDTFDFDNLQVYKCDRLGGANLDGDENVDWNDLRELTDWWLAGTEP